MSKPFLLGCALCSFVAIQGFAEEDSFTPKEIELTAPVEKKPLRKSPSVKEAFSPFTGRVAGEHVRMRLHPDLDSHIVQELTKDQLLLILDKEGDFYCVEPPQPVKAYIFRSFVLDDVVEGNRVNVRLAPDLEAPVIGHHNSGDRLQGKVSEQNRKWLEIAPPATTRFYVAKGLIDKIGGPELKYETDQRKETVAQLLQGAVLFAQAEIDRPFEEINYDRLKQGFLAIIQDYSDFPKQSKDAKVQLASFQEQYLERRIAYLEDKASGGTGQLYTKASTQEATESLNPLSHVNMWEPIENALFAAWSESHSEKGIEDYKEEQKLAAVPLSGTLTAYTAPVKNKPGDFMIKQNNLPVAYIYSTEVDLSEFVGKKVTVMGSKRSSNNFAFPAYCIHEVE